MEICYGNICLWIYSFEKERHTFIHNDELFSMSCHSWNMPRNIFFFYSSENSYHKLKYHRWRSKVIGLCLSYLFATVPPNTPVIYTGTGGSSTRVLQPFDEDSEALLLCEVIGGSPPPRVTWYLGDQMLDDSFTTKHVDITVNSLNVKKVSREFFKARLVCRASNTQLIPPSTAEIILDMNCKSSQHMSFLLSLLICAPPNPPYRWVFNFFFGEEFWLKRIGESNKILSIVRGVTFYSYYMNFCEREWI